MSCKDPNSFIRPMLARTRSLDQLPYAQLGQLGGSWGWSNTLPKYDWRDWLTNYERGYLGYGELELVWPPIEYVKIQDDFLGIGTIAAPSNIRGIIGYWGGAIDGNNDLIDSAGGDLTMSDNNGPIATSVTPSGAPCVDLDGVDQYFSYPDSAPVDITSSFTLGFWVKIDVWTKNAPFIGKWGALGQRSWTLYQEVVGAPPENIIVFHISSDGTNVDGVAQTSASYILGAGWNHVVARLIVDGSISIFVNGINYTEISIVPSAGPFNGNGIFGLGWNTNAGDYSDGLFADIWLSGVPLLDDEIAQIYADQASAYGY